MALGTDVGLGPDDIVLDWDPAPPPQKGGGAPPQFSAHVYCGQTAELINMSFGTDRPRPTRHCVRYGVDPAPPPLKWHSPRNFRPMSVVAKRLDGL